MTVVFYRFLQKKLPNAILLLLVAGMLYAQSPDNRGYIVNVGDTVKNIQFKMTDINKSIK